VTENKSNIYRAVNCEIYLENQYGRTLMPPESEFSHNIVKGEINNKENRYTGTDHKHEVDTMATSSIGNDPVTSKFKEMKE